MQKAEQAPKAADAVAGPQSPFDFTTVYRLAGAYCGVTVLAVSLELADGTVQRIELRSPSRPSGLSGRKQRIINVLGESPVPLTRLAVAHRCGLEDATGRFGRDLKELIESDALVYSHGQDVTDDPAKFAGG